MLLARYGKACKIGAIECYCCVPHRVMADPSAGHFYSAIVYWFFSVIDYYGFNITRFGRFLRCFMAGNRRLATPWWH